MSFNKKLFLILILAIGILIFRFWQLLTTPQPQVGKEIKITGKVLSEPVIFGQSQYFNLDEFRIRTKIFPKYHFGDKLEILGTPNENLLIAYPGIQKLGQEKGLLSQVFSLRRTLIDKSSQIWPQPESALFTGVILGEDSILPNFRENLIKTGTVHIVVVSGQNVSMLAAATTAILAPFLQRRAVSLLVILVIFFYTLLTGFQPPTVRAAIMGSLTFLAKLIGRENWGFWALGMAALTMLTFEPKLLFDISFQLSFAATFGILFAQSFFEKILSNFPKIIKETLSITFAAWIFTAPVIAFYFAQFTPITPISNLLVVPIVPFLMILGAFSVILALINLFLAKIVAVIPFIPATYFTFVIENLSKLPFANLTLPQINIFLVASFYTFVILIILWSRAKFLTEK